LSLSSLFGLITNAPKPGINSWKPLNGSSNPSLKVYGNEDIDLQYPIAEFYSASLTRVAGIASNGDLDVPNLAANVVTANNIAINITTLATTGTINLDFYGAGYRTMANITGTTTFTASNYIAGRTITVRIINGSAVTTRTINFPAGWVFVGPEPTSIAPLKTGILTITSFGTTEADCVAAYAVGP
jgi:hypothetical protein